MAPSFVEDTLQVLTLDEKVSLCSGKSYWRTPSIPATSVHEAVPAIKFSDGPNGVRGESIHGSTKTTCFPCGVCVGATFNRRLALATGRALARECQAKNAGVLLGPTVNLHRSPLAGRNFESYSEDPTLSGILASEYVKGLQGEGVAACPKHFLGNECETRRKISNSVIDEQTLRELYAYPFQWILKHADPWVMMTSYNKVNGVSMSENATLVQGLLRAEWGFNGVVMSDYEGTYSRNAAVEAGADIEMPGPPLHRGKALVEAVRKGELEERQIDLLARRVMELASKIGMHDESRPESISNDPETSQLLRDIASEGIVLLKNEKDILPISPSTHPKIAVFGSPAQSPVIHGGGSASLTASRIVSPLDGLREKYGASNVTYHPGVPIFKKIPSAPLAVLKTVSDGRPGIDCFWYNGRTFGEKLVLHEVLETTRTLIIDQRIKDLQPVHCNRMEYVLTPTTTGQHTFDITSCGATSLKVDGIEIVSHPGFVDVKVEYIMQPGAFAVSATIPMQGGQAYHVVIDAHATTAPPPSPIFAITPQATQIGFAENLNDPEGTSASIIANLASSSDISIVFTANNKEYESESFDRPSLSLSEPQNNLIKQVSMASKHTIVANQTGSPISMPWLEDVDAVLQCWFAGQEAGNALADVISGMVNPSGKLPTTFPRQIEDTASFGNFPTDDNDEVRYVEGLKMGYRALSAAAVVHKAPPLFPFGFGLSYSKFDITQLSFDGGRWENQTPNCEGVNLDVEVHVKNISQTAGSEVVQVYIDGVLRGFEKVSLCPDAGEKVSVALDKYAFSFWDVAEQAWRIEEREYVISICRCAGEVLLEEKFRVAAGKGGLWTGL